MKRNILITGGAGFIGSHVVRLFVNKYPDYRIVNLDKLTYAGNLANLKDVEDRPNYVFERADICDFDRVREIMRKYSIDGVIHLAAESHVDRSIKDPFTFARTNVLGTLSLLQAAREYWDGAWDGKLFYHISTDEVYGDLALDDPARFTEETPYHPSSPYSSTKASSDLLVRAWYRTFGVRATISNCSNNYGPYQHVEKFIPRQITNILEGLRPKLYGNGENVRDWLHVADHCQAIDLVIHKGREGEVYNIGGHNERTNLEVVKTILKALDKPESLIKFVTDRPGHDMRYAIDPTKIETELGWKPTYNFDTGIEQTIRWYLDNQDWWKNILSGEYSNYFDKMYGSRL